VKKEMETMEKIAVSWLLVWASSYLLTCVCAPGIAGDVNSGCVSFGLMGFAILGGLILFYYNRTEEIPLPEGKYQMTKIRPYINTARCVFTILALVSVYGCVTSWAGLVIWNVPYQGQAVVQVSMALADLISAVFMLILAFHC